MAKVDNPNIRAYADGIMKEAVDAPNNTFDTNNNPAPPVSNQQIADERKDREENYDWLDYTKASYNQGSILPPLLDTIHGRGIAPVEGYTPYTNKEQWAKDTNGIPTDNHEELLKSTSPAQFEFNLSRIRKNQVDLEHLSDLGVGRGLALNFVTGFVSPENLVAMAASGGFSFLAQTAKFAKTASAIKNATTATEMAGAIAERAAITANQVKNAGTIKSALTGVGSASAIGAGQEKWRQSLNFEDDSTQLLHAAIFTGLLSAPFAAAGAYKANRMSKAAMLDLQAHNAIKAELEGTARTPETQKLLDSHSELAEKYHEVDAGKAHPDEIDKIWDKIEASQGALKEKQLQDIQSEGQLHKGDEMAEAAKATTPSVEEPTAIQLAFQKAVGIKTGETPQAPKTPLHLQKVSSEPAPLHELIGSDVFWHSESGRGTDKGTVVGESANGHLVVEDRATGERSTIDRSDLHPDSPGHHRVIEREAVTGEPAYHPLLDALSSDSKAGESTLGQEGKQMELPVTPKDQSRSTSLPEDKSGFLGGSVGSAQVAHVPVGETTYGGHIPFLDRFGIKIPIRYDLYAKQMRSVNAIIQKWTHSSIKDAIGSKDGFTQGKTISEEVKVQNRVIAGKFHLEANMAFKEAANLRNMNALDRVRFQEKFFEMVTDVAAGNKEILAKNQDISSSIQKAATAQREVYTRVLADAKAAGVQGAEHVEVNDFYANRSWQTEKIRTLMDEHGKDAVYKMVANSFTDAKLHGNVKKAEAFLKVILNKEFNPVLKDIHLAPRDMATLRAELAKDGTFSKSEIDTLVDVMFEARKGDATKGDSGNATNLKFRMPLDEHYVETMANGKELRVSELMERDSRILVDTYVRGMVGQTAWAKKGIASKADFDKHVIQAAIEYHNEHNITNKEANSFNSELQWLKDIYDHTTGRPMSTQVFNTANRVRNIIGAYARSTYLGQLGLPALGELKQTAALTSMKALYMHSDGFKGLLSALKSGRLPASELMHEVEKFWGFGQEFQMAYARQHSLTEYTHDRMLTKAENLTNKASHAVDVISGNATTTSFTRQLSAMSFIQDYYHIASGSKQATAAKIKRAAHQGIEDDMFHDVMAHLKEYTTADAHSGRVETVAWEKWKEQHPESYEQFHTAIERETRDAIQDHDIGETMHFGHGFVGKIALELKTFLSVSHAKNFLKNFSYMDKTSFSVWMYALTGEALMYMAQTSINYAHDQSALDKKLTLSKISAAAVQRSSAFGMLPSIASTGYWMGTGNDLFGNVGTANTDNRDLFKTPTSMLAGKAFNSISAGATAMNPFATNITTKEDMRDALGLLPGGNTWGMRNLNDYVSGSFPKRELRQVVP